MSLHDMDYSIPEGLPSETVARLLELREELEDGDITAKGYRKHREQILAAASTLAGSDREYARSETSFSASSHARRPSGFESLMSWESPKMSQVPPGSGGTGPTGSGAGVGEPFVAGSEMGAGQPVSYPVIDGPLALPLPPRGIPETAVTDPLNVRVNLSMFDNLPSILRHRARTNGDITAFQVVDRKGKDAQAITWAKLASKAERVGQMLRDQSGLFRGDRVALVYAETEPIDFVVALMGCFLAGMVGVPVPQDTAVSTLPHILETTQSHLVLTSDTLHKTLVKQHQTFLASLPSVTWWKTSDWGSYNPPKKGGLPALQVPDLAYIEFVRSASGELRGVVMSHRTILHQMMCLTAILQSNNVGGKSKVRSDRLLCSLDIRRSTGLILGVLHTVYAGNLCMVLEGAAMTTPGLYAHVASRCRASVLLSDYPALKAVCYNYQTAPQATRQFSKRHSPDLGNLRWCLIDAATVDPEFQAVLADRWLTPLGHGNARAAVAPMLTLMEHGGMVIAMRDALGEDQPPDVLAEVVHLSRQALAQNRIEIAPTPNSQETTPVGTFGCPIPDATVAVVDPDTQVLSREGVVGEIWIDSPSLSGGFWAHSQDTDLTFHAKCLDANGLVPLEFLRSGLLGFVLNGHVYVLGVLSDRIYQEELVANSSTSGRSGTYFYSSHLMDTIVRSVPQVYDGCVFQISDPLGSGRQLACVLVETPLARKTLVTSTAATTSSRDKEMQYLEDMASQALAVLAAAHGFRVFCVLMTWPRAAPRTLRSGRPDIAKPATRRQFLRGSLQAAHIKFDVLGSIGDDIPRGDDVQGGVWSAASSNVRNHSLPSNADQQYSGVDMRTEVVDDRMAEKMGQPLDKFNSIVDILQWRLSKQPDELAYLTVVTGTGSGAGGVGTRETSWRQLDRRIAAVHTYIIQHLQAKEGDVALLNYTHSEDFVVAVLACFLAGVTVIPISPINTSRLDEDMGALTKLLSRFKVTFLLGNHDTQTLMEDKLVHHWLRQRRLSVPKLHNTAKLKSQSTGTIANIRMKPRTLSPTFPALVWLYFNADYEYTASQISHSALIGMCKIQKETCQMSSTKPLIGCVRSVCGLGFLHTCCLGIFVGASTILVSPFDYANNPAVYFVTVSRYKVKDGYATRQMLQHATKLSKPRGFDLGELQNLVVPGSGRADTEIVNNMRKVYASTGLETVAVNLAYGTTGNPMVTTRSYMLVENIDLWLDPVALRAGRVSVVNPANCPQALHLQDSGMVPINTQVAIVNPETRRLCRVGEIGEIWVVSDGNQSMFYREEAVRNDQLMKGVIVDGDPNVQYMRMGDLGFLHSVTKGAEVEMQVLFVVGALGRTFEAAGLQHFAEDVEASIVTSHSSFIECCIVVAGGLIVAIIETPAERRFMCSLAAVAASSVLQNHKFGLNCVAFVTKGHIPMSRLQEKQRATVVRQFVDGSLPLVGYYAVQATG